MQIWCSLPCLQNPTTAPHPQPHQSNPHILSLFFKTKFNIISHPILSLGGLFSGSPTSPVRFSLIRAICPAHLNLLELANVTAVSEGYKPSFSKKYIYIFWKILEGSTMLLPKPDNKRHTQWDSSTSKLLNYCPSGLFKVNRAFWCYAF